MQRQHQVVGLVGSGSEVVSPGSSTLHSHGGGSELREITV